MIGKTAMYPIEAHQSAHKGTMGVAPCIFYEAEEVGHILCACDYAQRLNGDNCMFYVPNLASLVPTSVWPGTEGNRKLPTRSEATVGEFER